MTTTKKKVSAVRFPLTRTAVGSVAVAGFLGLWAGIAATERTAAEPFAVPQEIAAVSPLLVVVERQPVYQAALAAGPAPASTVAPLPTAAPPAAPPRAPANPPRQSRGS